jgi:hypothetical protein
LNATQGTVAFVDMSNVLSEAKKQQVIALGRLGCPLRRIEQETGVRRETAGAYLKAAGIGVRPPGAWGRRPPAKPANTVNPNPNPENPSTKGKAKARTAKPAKGAIWASALSQVWAEFRGQIDAKGNPRPRRWLVAGFDR